MKRSAAKSASSSIGSRSPARARSKHDGATKTRTCSIVLTVHHGSRIHFPGHSRISSGGRSYRRFGFTTSGIRTRPWRYPGTDFKTISAALGHSTISITANIYVHAIEAMQRAHADRIEAVLGDAVASAIGEIGANAATSVPQRCHALPFTIKKARKYGPDFGSPSGIRTRVTAVRGRRPRPLDDRAVAPGDGLEPPTCRFRVCRSSS